MNIFLVLPAYNEEVGLQKLLPELVKLPYSLLIVDDCSEDSTFEYLNSFPEIAIISNKKNLGYSISLQLCIESAFTRGASHVITLDSDGQHPLYVLPQIEELLQSGSECVLTSRDCLKPRVSEQIIGMFSNYIWSVPDLYCGMRGFSRSFWSKYFKGNKSSPCLEYPFVQSLLSGFEPDILSFRPLQRFEGKPRFSAHLSAELLIFKSFVQSFFM